jgi:hypothetical protein
MPRDETKYFNKIKREKKNVFRKSKQNQALSNYRHVMFDECLILQ